LTAARDALKTSKNLLKFRTLHKDEQRPVLQKVQTKASYIGRTPENKHQQKHSCDQHP